MSDLKYSEKELEELLGLSRRRVNELCKDLNITKRVIPILRPRKSISRWYIEKEHENEEFE